MQAQNLAFQLDDKPLSQSISLEMIELVGRYDMNLCSQLIAFYQVKINIFSFVLLIRNILFIK